VTVRNSLIARNYRGISGIDYSVEVDRSTIRDNDGQAMYFMFQQTYIGSNYIHDSSITRNKSYALYMYSLKPAAASAPHGTRNNIYDNRLGNTTASPTSLAMPYYGQSVDWTGNFWGVDVDYVPAQAGCDQRGWLGRLMHGNGDGPRHPVSQTTNQYSEGSQTVQCPTDHVDTRQPSLPYIDSGAPLSIDPNNPLVEDNWRTFGSCVTGLHAETPMKCMGDPVQSATGNFAHSAVDLRLPGVGAPFEFTRSYNSLDTSEGPLGRGWTHSYDLGLGISSNGDVVFRGEHGQQLQYTKQVDGSYAGTAGVRSSLEKTADGYKLTRRDQVVYGRWREPDEPE
jgi:uncharacterized protein DUF6531